jgi:hypothetical protein
LQRYPALCPDVDSIKRILQSSPLPSTISATGLRSPGLFDGFFSTMGLSDSLWPYIVVVLALCGFTTRAIIRNVGFGLTLFQGFPVRALVSAYPISLMVRHRASQVPRRMRTSLRRSPTPPGLFTPCLCGAKVLPKIGYKRSGTTGHDFGAQYYALMHSCQRLPTGITAKGHDSEYDVTGQVFIMGTCTRNILPACPGASITIFCSRIAKAIH